MAKYSKDEIEELFSEVISCLESGHPLGRTLDQPGMPSRTAFYKWLEEEKGYAERYARACDLRADAIFDEMLEIVDDTSQDHTPFTGSNVIQRDRLRIDARKWVLAKMAPKKYGDKIDVTSGNEALAVPAIVGMVIKNEIQEDGPSDYTDLL